MIQLIDIVETYRAICSSLMLAVAGGLLLWFWRQGQGQITAWAAGRVLSAEIALAFVLTRGHDI